MQPVLSVSNPLSVGPFLLWLRWLTLADLQLLGGRRCLAREALALVKLCRWSLRPQKWQRGKRLWASRQTCNDHVLVTHKALQRHLRVS